MIKYAAECLDCKRIPLFFETHNERQDWLSDHEARFGHSIYTWLEAK